MGLVRRSQDTLTHWGIPGQKWGVRRWQYPDGRFTEEGKERYFGKNAESEGYVTKNKDGSYSTTKKGVEKIINDIDSVNSNILNKLTGIEPAKKMELIELGSELVYRQMQKIKTYTIEDAKKELFSFTVSKIEYAPGYEDLAKKIDKVRNKLSDANNAKISRSIRNREKQEGFTFNDVPESNIALDTTKDKRQIDSLMDKIKQKKGIFVSTY